MPLHIGDKAPDFTMKTTQGELNFHKWLEGSWGFFFSHPADFTPVCTTEMGRTAQLSDAFSARNVKPLGLSTDGVDAHLKWISDVDDTQKTRLDFPLVADADLKIARLYDMLHPNESQTATVRSIFIIDPRKTIRLMMTYPMTVGRNFDEILRVIDALQTVDEYGVATPADWRPGEKVIIPLSVNNEEAREKFPQGWEELRSYLRITAV